LLTDPHDKNLTIEARTQQQVKILALAAETQAKPEAAENEAKIQPIKTAAAI
jgi:hypothetical protein